MTLEEAEAILGPATSEDWPPVEQGRGAVVKGNCYYRWDCDGMEFHVATRNRRISGTWFWAPSL
jgi:hypothetical protein